MKQTRLWLATIAVLLCSLTASAHDFVVGGIYYNITSSTDHTVEVTSSGGIGYSGSIYVPATVTYNGVEYSVTSIGNGAFFSSFNLTSITIPKSVTSIGERAFLGCSSLTSITLPEGVTSIGERAFDVCSKLTAVHISSLEVWCNIDFANYSANPLYYAKNLYLNGGLVTELTIPNSVTAIKNFAFCGCSSLTAITIPEGVTSIGERAFYSCYSLTAINIPEDSKLTSIGGSAFYKCSRLAAITIPEGVTSIGYEAFYGCRSLTTITIPENSQLTSIGGSAFYDCESLTTITIPENSQLTNIGEYAFYNCSSLTAITIPENSQLTNIGEYAFSGCSSLTAITIPESVTSIGERAFSYCSSLTAINIPEGVTSIGSSAFNGCESLKTVINYSDLPLQRGSNDYGNVAYYAYRVINVDEVIDGYAFKTIEGVHYLTGYIGDKTELTLPADYKGENYQIGDEAFYNCSSLTAITIPESVTSIGGSAFYNCSSLTSITIPESVTSIGSEAFRGCSRLTAITIPESVTSIGGSAFYNCSRLTAITIPESVTSIGSEAFRGCSRLAAITIPEGVTSIGGSAFYNCSSLTSITIPENVTNIGGGAFSGCKSLKTVINYSGLPLQRGSNDYGHVAYYADKVINIDEVIDGYAFKTTEGVHYLTGYIGDDTELILPADYKGENYQIGDRAFYGCSSLTAITIPEGVTSIEKSTFQGCSSLKELTLGKGLKKIAAGAFNSCTALEKVTIYATRPPSIDGTGNAFFSDATYENATLYVPQGCIDKYQVMAGWSSFYTFEEMEGGTPNYLTLRQADNGEVGIVVDLGRTYKVRITAFEGWKIHSVTFNGEEVTAQLTEEGLFTTPALQADAVLNIAYEKTDNNTMVANASASRIKVQGRHGTLRITGATEGDDISVYTTDGMLVAQESAEGAETELTLPTGQVYIVTVADKVVKIGM